MVKHYEGIGEVAFVMRETDKLWVRANRPGLSLLLDCFTDSVEAGAFTYRVSHENGVVVRTAPGLDAPPVKVRYSIGPIGESWGKIDEKNRHTKPPGLLARLDDDDFPVDPYCKYLEDPRKACAAVCWMLAP